MKDQGFSLTEKQLEGQTAKRLLTLLKAVSADGRLTDDEVDLLNEWLNQAKEDNLPALAYLRKIIAEVLDDHEISDVERHDVVSAILCVMPEGDRRDARLRYGCAERRDHGVVMKAHQRDEIPLPATCEQMDAMMILGIKVPKGCTYCEASRLLFEKLCL
jgi:hypothetical protein